MANTFVIPQNAQGQYCTCVDDMGFAVCSNCGQGPDDGPVCSRCLAFCYPFPFLLRLHCPVHGDNTLGCEDVRNLCRSQGYEQ